MSEMDFAKLFQLILTPMKKTLVTLMAMAGTVIASAPEWNFVDNNDGTATYSITLTGDYNIDLGDAAIQNGETFTLYVETIASGWANGYGTGLVATSNPYDGSNGADNFRMYFGRPGNNSQSVVFAFNNWTYDSNESKLTGVDASAAPVDPTQETPLTLGMVFTYNGSSVLVTNSENSQVLFTINESNIVTSFNFAKLTNMGAASIPNAVTTISITKAYTAPVVPEPTTATLSMLALAGLAMRRRRK